MKTMQTDLLPYTSVFIKLLKGPLEYTEKNQWEKLLLYKKELTQFLRTLGLSLVLQEEDGYAYLKHFDSHEDEGAISWSQKRSLNYEESLLLILLREMMGEFETGEAISRELIKKRREIKEYAELFFKENASRVRFMQEIDKLIDRVAEYGFLQLLEDHEIDDEQRFRIKKIIKSKIGSEELEDFYQQMVQFQESRQQKIEATKS